MIRGAKSSLDFAEFYASDDGADSNDAIDRIVREIEAAAARGVKVRFVTSSSFYKTYPQIVDRLRGVIGDGAEPGCSERRSRRSPHRLQEARRRNSSCEILRRRWQRSLSRQPELRLACAHPHSRAGCATARTADRGGVRSGIRHRLAERCISIWHRAAVRGSYRSSSTTPFEVTSAAMHCRDHTGR